MLDSIISLFAPHSCLGCNTEGYVLCDDCSQGLPTWPSVCYRCGAATENGETCALCHRRSPLAAIHVLTHYEGLAKDVVWRLKFAGAQAAAKDMTRLLTKRLALPTGSYVVYVPTASSHVRVRGYDQARLLARQIGRQTGAQQLPCLVRLGQARQVGSNRNQRVAQVADAFRLAAGYDVKGISILLVDDVLTTGATLESAARLLKKAGAARVEAVVFSRA